MVDEIIEISSEEYLALPCKEFTKNPKKNVLYRTKIEPRQLLFCFHENPLVWSLGPKVKIKND